jgi:hypothetical protein
MDRYPWGATPSRDPRYLDARRATCYGRLGATTEAVELWAAVLDQLPADAHRNRGTYSARYAAALLDLDAADAALIPATEAVGCVQRAPSARLRRELAQLRDRAADRQDSPAGRDLYDVLHTV